MAREVWSETARVRRAARSARHDVPISGNTTEVPSETQFLRAGGRRARRALDAVLTLLGSAAGRLRHQIGDSVTGFDSALDPSNSPSAAPIAAARSGAASGVGAE